MKTVFFGTPDFSTPFLQALNDDPGIEVVAVVCQPDKPSGRGKKLAPPATKVLAEELGLPVLQPPSLKDSDVCKHLEELQAQCFIVVAYGKIIPQSILDIPTNGTLNVHPSLLPQYRGPSPMQWAIANGDKETGVSVMLLDAGMDTGPILTQEHIELTPKDTYTSLTEKVHAVAPKLLTITVKDFVSGKLTPQEQDDSRATATRLLTREDGHIDWTQSAKHIDQLVRAYTPWPGTWSFWKQDTTQTRLKFLEVSVDESAPVGVPGEVSIDNHNLIVACGVGNIIIHVLQSEGKPKMKAEAFIQGNAIIDGSCLT